MYKTWELDFLTIQLPGEVAVGWTPSFMVIHKLKNVGKNSNYNANNQKCTFVQLDVVDVNR